MNRFTLIAGLAAGSLALGAVQTRAADLAEWTFEVSVPSGTGSSDGPYAAEEGLFATSSFASGFHADSTTAWSNPVGNGSGESYSSNRWGVGDYYQFQTSTAGYESVMITFDQTRSSTGPAEFALQYSTDGTTFTTAGSYTVDAISWSSTTFNPDSRYTFDLSSISGLDNQTEVFFRLAATAEPSAATGTNRVDNFLVSATLIPEPATAGLLGLGGLTLLARRRRA